MKLDTLRKVKVKLLDTLKIIIEDSESQNNSYRCNCCQHHDHRHRHDHDYNYHQFKKYTYLGSTSVTTWKFENERDSSCNNFTLLKHLTVKHMWENI